MKLDEILSLWETDSKLDRSDLASEAIKLQQLHHKYWKILSNERVVLKKRLIEKKELERDKFEYYSGKMSISDVKERGWEPNDLKILRTDVDLYLKSDKELNEKGIQIDIQQEKVDFLVDIIRSLHERGFLIKSAVDWITKIEHGA